jgi:hypothetical protein
MHAENHYPESHGLALSLTHKSESHIVQIRNKKFLSSSPRVVGGQCNVHSGILFIDPKEYEKVGQSGREFLSELNKISPWKRTGVWSHGLALRPCESPPQTGQINAVGQRDRRGDRGYQENTISAFWIGAEKRLKGLRLPRINLMIPSLPRVRLPSSVKLRKPTRSLLGRKEVRFLVLIPLLLASLLLGLILSFLSVKETSHRHHSSEEHHHR